MTVQCDVWHDADPFSRCSFFLTGFPRCFPGCSFEVCRSALMSLVTFAASRFHSAGKAVCFECVFVSLPVCLILLHSAACLSWMWFCRFQPCRSLPSLMEKFCKIIVFHESVDLIGYINHAQFLWETLPHADPWLIAQLSLLFLSYVFVIDVLSLNKVFATMLSWEFGC